MEYMYIVWSICILYGVYVYSIWVWSVLNKTLTTYQQLLMYLCNLQNHQKEATTNAQTWIIESLEWPIVLHLLRQRAP